MTVFRVDVRVLPRASLLDPQGQAVHHALTALGFTGIDGLRIGKALTFTLDADDSDSAHRQVTAMCEKLLANPVTEDFSVSVREAS